MKKLILALITVSAFTACNKDNENPNGENNNTKTYYLTSVDTLYKLKRKDSAFIAYDTTWCENSKTPIKTKQVFLKLNYKDSTITYTLIGEYLTFGNIPGFDLPEYHQKMNFINDTLFIAGGSLGVSDGDKYMLRDNQFLCNRQANIGGTAFNKIYVCYYLSQQ